MCFIAVIAGNGACVHVGIIAHNSRYCRQTVLLMWLLVDLGAKQNITLDEGLCVCSDCVFVRVSFFLALAFCFMSAHNNGRAVGVVR